LNVQVLSFNLMKFARFNLNKPRSFLNDEVLNEAFKNIKNPELNLRGLCLKNGYISCSTLV
jgi:hypothetical protein